MTNILYALKTNLSLFRLYFYYKIIQNIKIVQWLLEYKWYTINLLDIENKIGDFCLTEVIQFFLQVFRQFVTNIGEINSKWINN